MSKDLFVKWREEGTYAMRKPSAKRASATAATQEEAINRSQQLDPDAAIHVERVRHTSNDSPDKWRKL